MSVHVDIERKVQWCVQELNFRHELSSVTDLPTPPNRHMMCSKQARETKGISRYTPFPIRYPCAHNLCASLPTRFTTSTKLLKVGLHGAILDTVHSQLEDKVRTLDLHMQLKVQIVELDAFGGC